MAPTFHNTRQINSRQSLIEQLLLLTQLGALPRRRERSLLAFIREDPADARTGHRTVLRTYAVPHFFILYLYRLISLITAVALTPVVVAPRPIYISLKLTPHLRLSCSWPE